MNRIFTRARAFVDDNGCERFFHGINMVYKGDHAKSGVEAFLPNDWDEALVSRLRDHGFNCVRLGLIWEAVEPKPGEYCEEYLKFFLDFADILKKYGIYFYLDMHQDLFGAMGTPWGGDGAPDWAYLSDGKTPRKPFFVWAEGYFFPGSVTRGFDAFWHNKRAADGVGVKDRFCAMWAHVAERFRDKENLLGFDVFNEPFPGSSGSKVFLKVVKNAALQFLFNDTVPRKEIIGKIMASKDVGAIFDTINDPEVYRKVLAGTYETVRRFDLSLYYPFLRQVSAAIRQKTDKGVIFAENCYFSNMGIPCSVPLLAYKNGTKEKNFAFAPHGYELTVDTPLMESAPVNRVEFVFREHIRTQERLDVPVLVGEWGGFNGDTPGSRRHLGYLLDFFDANLWSNTFWCYHRAMEEAGVLALLRRPYPHSVPGNTESFHYDADNTRFTLTFDSDKKSKKPARIYLPAEPKQIDCPGKYKLNSYGSAFMLEISPVAGKNSIEITL
ncbi:MAG: cellulase family glycosylhydrolase [Clostridia bacterium]|nr:cellulase family glycosylhydrolase [Clostridia bacterium]